MKFQGFHHIGLYAQDAEKSLEFYKKLGAKVSFSFPMSDTGKTIYLVDLGGHAVVEIIPKGNGKAEQDPHWAHICLDTDDCQAAYDLAISAGAVSRIPPQDVMLGTMAVRNAFVLGPDGEDIEFFEVK